MQSIPKLIFQTQLNEWNTIEEQIERSKIKRYPYKSLLGMSLTRFIIICMQESLNIHQTFAKILENEKIKHYLLDNILEQNKIQENIWIGVCARFSESKMYKGKI